MLFVISLCAGIWYAAKHGELDRYAEAYDVKMTVVQPNANVLAFSIANSLLVCAPDCMTTM
jgi:hypothetical protein